MSHPLAPPAVPPDLLAHANWLSVEIVRHVDEEGDVNLFASITLKGDQTHPRGLSFTLQQNLRPEDPAGTDRLRLLEVLREFCQPLPAGGVS